MLLVIGPAEDKLRLKNPAGLNRDFRPGQQELFNRLTKGNKPFVLRLTVSLIA